MTMRSDFIGKFAIWPDFSCFIMDHVVLVESMDRDQMTRAIEKPARLVGLSFETGLVDRILNDITGAASELPLLEHALFELYHRRRDNCLVTEAYDQIGGIEGALTRRAESEYALLDEKQQQMLRKMFVLCLIQPGEGTEDTRRRATMVELLAVGGDPEQAEKLVATWIHARLLTSYRDDARNLNIVDVAHEALIRRWHQIDLWMSEDRETARQLNNLRRMTSVWKESAEDPDLLPRGVALARMIDLLEREGTHLTPGERSFVEAGCAAKEHLAKKQEELRKRELHSARVLAFRAKLIALITLSSMLILALFSWWVIQREKRTKRKLAESYLFASGEAWKEKHVAQTLHYDVAAIQTGMLSEQSLRIHYQMILNQTPQSVVLPHQAYVRGASFNRDGSNVLTWGEDHTVRLWDPVSGLQIGPTMFHDGVLGASYYRDFSRILSWGSSEIRTWNPDNGQVIEPVIHGSNNKVVISKDNRRLLATDSSQLRIWDMKTGEQLGPSMFHPEIFTAVFSPDERFILSSGADNISRLWNSSSGQLVAALERAGRSIYHGFSSNGERIYTVDMSLSVGLWDGSTGENILFFPKHPDGPKFVLLSRDGSLMYLFGGEGIKIIDNRGNQVGPLLPHTDATDGFLNRLETKIVSWNSDSGQFRIWDITTGREIGNMKHDVGGIWGARFNQKEDKIMSWGRALHLWDGTTGNPIGRPLLHDDNIKGAEMDRSEKRILTWSYDGTARVWELADVLKPNIRMRHEKQVNGALLDKSGKRVLSYSQDGTARLWDSEGKEIFVFSHEASVNGAVFDAKEERILTYGDDKTVRVWNCRNGRQLLPSMSTNDEVFAASFDQKEQRIISLTKNMSLAQWDVSSGDPLAPPIHGKKPVAGWSFDKNRSHFLTWGEDVQLWENGANIRMIANFKHDETVTKAILSQDGKRIVSTIKLNSILVWDVASGRKIATHLSEKALYEAIPMPTGNEILVLDWAMFLWNPDTGERKRAMLHDRWVIGAKLSKGGERILSWGADKTVRVWNTKTGKQIGSSMFHAFSVHQEAFFNSDETRILSTTSHTNYWDAATGLPLGPIMQHPAETWKVKIIDANETHLLAIGGEWINIWPIGTDDDLPISLLALQTRVITAVDFNPVTRVQTPLVREELEQTRADYLKQAAAHYATCRYPEYNFFRKRFPKEAEKVKPTP